MFALALTTLLLGVWSRRLKVRNEGTPASLTALGVKYGMLYVWLFPLAMVFAGVALAIAVHLTVGGRTSSVPDVDDGCGSVDLAVRWLSSEAPSDRELGALVAAEVWKRSRVDDAYSLNLGDNCPVEVTRMIELAGLSDGP